MPYSAQVVFKSHGEQMQHTRRITALKILGKAKGQLAIAVFKLAEDVRRNPDGYSAEEKIRLFEFASREYQRALKNVATSSKIAKDIRSNISCPTCDGYRLKMSDIP